MLCCFCHVKPANAVCKFRMTGKPMHDHRHPLLHSWQSATWMCCSSCSPTTSIAQETLHMRYLKFSFRAGGARKSYTRHEKASQRFAHMHHVILESISKALALPHTAYGSSSCLIEKLGAASVLPFLKYMLPTPRQNAARDHELAQGYLKLSLCGAVWKPARRLSSGPSCSR